VLDEPRPLAEWRPIDLALTSEFTRIEALRTIDRALFELRRSDTDVAERRALVLGPLDSFHLAHLDGVVLERAAEPLPSLVRTPDAIHLATALLLRAEHRVSGSPRTTTAKQRPPGRWGLA
jgi:predicted nucleic acid-binding protein